MKRSAGVRVVVLLLALVALGTLAGIAYQTPLLRGADLATLAPNPAVVRFAVIGDYGTGDRAARDVAALVKSWNPEFIVTTGDNNYPSGAAGTMDRNVGQFYHEFLYPYAGRYGAGASALRFFPALGNHDWDTDGAAAYLAYFTLPGNERYYDFTWRTVHVFVLDSDRREPDGIAQTSVQAHWLRQGLAASRAPWKLVIVHHPPYSSGLHGSSPNLQWPFAAWGAAAVISGHAHSYERLARDGIPYFVNGAGGRPLRSFQSIAAGSELRYADDNGAMLVEADDHRILFRFYSRTGQLVDRYALP